MKRLTLLSLLLLAVLPLRAQSLAAFRERLAQTESIDGQAPARVRVVEWGDAAAAVQAASEQAGRIRFSGYRVGIFFDNGEHARANAVDAKTAFAEAFPDVQVYMVYENPYFKVSAGNCVTSEEAIVLLGRIRSRFPGAYLMREEMSVADLVR